MERLLGRTAFITGAASGIGRAQALGFAQEGARISGLAVPIMLGAARRTHSYQSLRCARP